MYGYGVGPNILDGIKNVINSARAVNDPNVLMTQMAQNPNMAQAIQYVKEHGGDPKTACMELLRSKGIDPGDISKMVSGK